MSDLHTSAVITRASQNIGCDLVAMNIDYVRYIGDSDTLLKIKAGAPARSGRLGQRW